MAQKSKVNQEKADKYRVQFKYNSETMVSTEDYGSKASAMNAMDSIKKNGPDAAIVEA